LFDNIILGIFDGYWLFLALGMCEGKTVGVVVGKVDEISGRIVGTVADGLLDGTLDIIIFGAFNAYLLMLSVGVCEGTTNGAIVGIYDGISGRIVVSIADGLLEPMFDGIILVTFNGY